MEKAEAVIAFKSLTIETDGTKGGTKILLNGKPIDDLAYLNFSFWNDGYSCPVSVGFSTRDPDPKPGTLVQNSDYSLICPKETDEANATKATASFQKQPAVPVDALPRGQRQNIYAKL